MLTSCEEEGFRDVGSAKALEEGPDNIVSFRGSGYGIVICNGMFIGIALTVPTKCVHNFRRKGWDQ